ncbi:Inner membrane transport protein YajR [Saliniradius amylolyticus]|uniref:Inner membrane transport protein YajR n=1 Tax=Saliniradius amylolyticus TaxID=2183582 RepID=A0A2S2DZH0_9ALTE|nr:MFS transporter [Saliniradius amylolyticus]AWL10776.1 Inner membrane transport protein YajR [Saliniradius amylolyticus]
MNRLEIRGASSLASVYVLRMLGLFMVMPVLPILALEYADYTPLLLGLAIGGYGLTQALLQIPFGILSDKWGRKPVIMLGLGLFALGSAVAGLADSLWVVVLGRLLQGTGAIAGAVMALAGDISRDSERPKVMAIIGVAIGFSFYLSLLLGPMIGAGFGLTGLFLITALLALLCIPLVWWVVPDSVNLAPTGDTLPNWQKVRALFANATLMRLNLSVFVLHLLMTLLFVYLPTRFSEQGWSLAQHWQLYLPILIASVLGMVVLMRLARVRGVRAILMLSVGLLGLSLLGLALLPPYFTALLVLIWLFFSGFNYVEANLPALVSSLAPAGEKGSAMGIYASFQFAGAALGGVVAGGLSQWLSESWVLLFAALTCLVWLLWLMQGQFEQRHLKRYQLPLTGSPEQMQQLAKQLADWAGVRDLTLVPEERTLYLKVDGGQFSLKQARDFVSQQDKRDE